MKIYKVSLYSHQEYSVGFSFYSSKLKADNEVKRYKKVAGDDFNERLSSVELIEVVPTRQGIIDALNQYASHNDNG